MANKRIIKKLKSKAAKEAAAVDVDLSSLASALNSLSINVSKNTEALNKSIAGNLAETGTTESGELVKKKSEKEESTVKKLGKEIQSFADTVTRLGNKLEKFTSELNKTQKDFGISITAAAKLQVNALKNSTAGFIEFFKSIDFGQLFGELGDVMSTMAGVATDAGKELLTGNTEGFKTTLSQGMGKVFNEFTKERPKEKALGPIPALPKEILAGTKAYQDEFGIINEEMGEKLATQAKNQGLNVEQLVQARRAFATVALGDLNRVDKIQTRFFDQFKAKGMSPKIALEVATKYAELIARNGTRFADSFARAAADAKKIGVDLSKVDQIGDNIISDFEGFLESQAELGAMGFNFDSSRLAELAESGDTGALFNELRSQLAMTGKDITKLRRSERLALESAFGINISDMLKIAGGTPDSGKTQEDYLEDNNSLLGKLLVLMAVGGPFLSAVGSALGSVAKAIDFGLGSAGELVKALGKLAGLLGSVGLTGTVIGLLAIIASYYALKYNDKQYEKIGSLNEQAKQLFLKGDVAAGKEAQQEALIREATTVIGSSPMAVAIAGDTQRERRREYLSDYLLNQQQGPISATATAPNKLGQYQFTTSQQTPPPPTTFSDMMGAFRPSPYAIDKELRPPKKGGFLDGIVDKIAGKYASGGPIQGPGTSTSDSIPARLSDGEYVVNAKSASVAGNGLLNLINNTKDKRQLLTALLRSISMTPESQFLFDEQKTTNKMTDKYGNVIMRAEGGPVEKPGTTTPKPGLFDRIKNFAKTGTISVPSVATPTVEQTEEQVNKLDTKSFNKIIEGFNKLAKFGEKLNTTADKITDPDGGLNKVATAGEKKGFMSKLGELTKVLGKQPDGTDGEPKDFMSKLNTITGIFSKKSEQTESSTEGEKKGFISKLSGLADMFSKKPEGTEGESKGFMSKISGLTSLFTKKPEGTEGESKGFMSKISGLSAMFSKKPEGTEGESKGFMSKINGLTSMFSKKPGETPDTGEKKGFMSKMGDIAGILGVGKAPGEGGESKTAMSKFSEITGLFAKKQTGPDDKKGFMGTVSGIASIFGKKESEGGGTFAQKALSSAQSIKGVGKFLGKVPGFGGVASAIAGGEGIKGAITSTASAGVGKWVGGLLGSAIPIPGVGTLLGSLAGDWAGKKLGGLMSSAGSGIKKLFTKGKDGKSMAGKIAGYTPAGLAVKGLNKFADSKIGKFTGVGLAKKALTSNVGKSIMKYSPAGLVAGGIGKLGKMFKPKPQVTPENVETMTSPDLSMMIGSQRYTQPEPAPQQAPTVDTRGIEQKLNNFINALQGIQINMDGAQVGKVLVNTSDAAMTTGVFRLQSR